jgi:hypothetical protein
MNRWQGGRVRRFTRWALPAALLVSAIGVPAATASPLLPTLTGTTVVSASQSAYTVVRVPRQIRFIDSSSAAKAITPPRITVSDQAHFVAVALVDQASAVVNDYPLHPSAMVMSLPTGAGGYRYWTRLPGPAETIPAGTYWLYVLATAPERVVWHLPLPGGTRNLRAGTPARMHTTVAVAPQAAGTVAPMARAYGHAIVSNHAQLWSLIWTHGSNLAADEPDACDYDGADPIADDVESLPAFVCKGIETSFGGVGVGSLDFPGDRIAWAFGTLEPGVLGWPNVGFKMSDETAGQVQWTAGRNIWLDLP